MYQDCHWEKKNCMQRCIYFSREYHPWSILHAVFYLTGKSLRRMPRTMPILFMQSLLKPVPRIPLISTRSSERSVSVCLKNLVFHVIFIRQEIGWNFCFESIHNWDCLSLYLILFPCAFYSRCTVFNFMYLKSLMRFFLISIRCCSLLYNQHLQSFKDKV